MHSLAFISKESGILVLKHEKLEVMKQIDFNKGFLSFNSLSWYADSKARNKLNIVINN